MTAPPEREESSAEPEGHEDEVHLMHKAFVAALVGSGVMGKLRAQLRTAAIGIVRSDARRVGVFNPNKPPSALSESEKIALLLVQDLLRCGGYSCAQGVFDEEATMDQLAGADRRSVADALGMSPPKSTATPLLVELVSRVLESGVQSQSGDDAGGGGDDAECGSTAASAAPEPDIESHRARVPDAATAPEVVTLEKSVQFSDVSDSGSLEEGSEWDVVEPLVTPSRDKGESRAATPETAAPAATAARAVLLPPVLAAHLSVAAPRTEVEDDPYAAYDQFEKDDDDDVF